MSETCIETGDLLVSGMRCTMTNVRHFHAFVAVPDPTVEALSEAERSAVEFAVCEDLQHTHVEGHDDCERAMAAVVTAVERIIAARVAAPDPLRDRLQALCDAAMRNQWHLGAEAVSVTVAQVLAVVGEDGK